MMSIFHTTRRISRGFIVSVTLALSMIFLSFFTAKTHAQSDSKSDSKLSLQAALKAAVENNTTYKNALLETGVSVEKANDVANKYLPRIGASLDVRANVQRPTIVIPFPDFSARPDANGELPQRLTAIQQGTPFSTSVGVDVTQPIFDATLAPELAHARTQQAIAENNALKARIDLAVSVSQAYYAALLAQEKVRQAEAAARRTENFHNDVQAKFKNANALKTDVSRAYLNASNAAQNLRQAKDALRLALLNVSTLIGWNNVERTPEEASSLVLTEPFAESSSVHAVTEAEMKAIEAASNQALKQTEKQSELPERIELRTERLQREASAQLLQRAANQALPTLSAYGFLGTQSFRETFGFDGQWYAASYVGVKLNVPVLEWLTRAPQMQQQSLAMLKSEQTLAGLAQTIRYEIQNTSTTVLNTARNLNLQRENVGIAEELLQSVTARYKQGTAPQQEVIEAESTLRDTQTQYAQALHDFFVAKIQWERALARL
jgi:outer membrane protein